jgi:peptidoglycan/xylan/chitin deacetylase (PgdA/CDA1 family)
MPLNRRDFIRITAASVGGWVTSGLGDSAFALAPDISHGPREQANVALTFHANGDSAHTKKLLEILRAHSTPVTIFAVGAWIKANPGMTKTMLADGHDIGNHTYSHTQMKTISAAQVDSEIRLCADELKREIGNHGSFFRPSGTQNSTALIRKTAAKYGYSRCISYEVDSLDYLDVSKAKVISAVMGKVKNGSIVSMHFGHQNTIDAMPALLEQLSAKGLTPVTLSKMLGKI